MKRPEDMGLEVISRRKSVKWSFNKPPVNMLDYAFQILWLIQLLATVQCHHLFFPPGPGVQYQPPPPQQPGFGYEFRGPPRLLPQAQPLLVNPQTIPQYQQLPIYPIRPSPHQYTPSVQPLQLYRLPDQTVVVPLKTFNGFPPFIERIVQRIQTYYSIYNPIESLTRPPTYNPSTTTKPQEDMELSDPPKGKPVQSVQIMSSNNRPHEESSIVGEVTTSKMTIKNKVSTLTIYEVQPAETTTLQSTTMSSEEEETTDPPDLGGTTEEPNFISPENASVAAKSFRYDNFPLDQFFYKSSSKHRTP